MIEQRKLSVEIVSVSDDHIELINAATGSPIQIEGFHMNYGDLSKLEIGKRYDLLLSYDPRLVDIHFEEEERNES